MKHKIEKKAFKRVDISHVLELKALQQELIKRERDWQEKANQQENEEKIMLKHKNIYTQWGVGKMANRITR